MIYSRPDKPMRASYGLPLVSEPKLELKETVEPVYVDKGTEAHITPQAQAELMVDYLGLFVGCSVLEPSAGTGNLIKALMDHGDYEITAVEMNYSLFNTFCDWEGIKAFQGDFLLHEGKYDRVIMNPPFRQCKKHVTHAFSLLKEDGILVALVPSNFEMGQELETFSGDTFASTKVFTKLIMLEK